MPKRTKENAQEILYVDPGKLLENNPAALIVNETSYQRMEASFSPNLLDPPWVAHVNIADWKEKEPSLQIVDGLTRTKFAKDHKGSGSVRKFGVDFRRFPVKNVTEDLLKDPSIASSDRKETDLPVMEMPEYLRAVIPPTIVHRKIAVDRVALHLVNGWEKIVGTAISSRFSAVAALHLLAHPDTPMGEKKLAKFLAEQDNLVAGANEAEQRRVANALLEVTDIVQRSALPLERVAQAAFALVSKGGIVIGGKEEQRRQVYGLLHQPSVEKKLVNAAPAPAEREQLRLQLGEVVAATFGRTTEKRELQTVNDALVDDRLPFEQTLLVLEADSPSAHYEAQLVKTNRQTLTEYYLQITRRDAVSPLERTLLDGLVRSTSLYPAELDSFSRAVSTASEAFTQASAYRQQLEQIRLAEAERLRTKGLREATVFDEHLQALNAALEKFDEPLYGLGMMAQRAGRAREVMRACEDAVRLYTATLKVAPQIEAVFGNELTGADAAKLQSDVLQYVLGGAVDNVVDTTAVERTLKELKELSPDLRSDVLSGRMRVPRARQIQDERGVSARRLDAQPTAQPDRTVGIEPVSPRRTQQPWMEEPTRPVLRLHPSQEQRIAQNNTQFGQLAETFMTDLLKVDLDPEELTPESRDRGKRVIRTLGKLVLLHPDAPRAVEEHQAEIARKIREAQERAAMELEEHTKQTRTEGH